MRRQGGHSQMHMAEVVLKNLKKVYPNTEKKKKKGEPEKKNDLQITDEGVVAVQDFNLHIADKEFIVLVGPSGCGKSTTLRMIAGLEDISGGELYIDGKLMNDVEPKDRDIAMVFQSYALYPHMTVYGNMAFSLKLKKVPKDEIDRRVRQAAEILDITQYLDRKPKALSGGQRQRVAMGRAIVREPSVFLFDEPLSNLDANLRNQMRIELRRLHQRLATTSIYVTHDQVEAMTLAEKILVLRAGNIEQYGTPDDIYLHPASVFVAQFRGSPSMNMIPATTDGEKLILPDGTPLSGVAASDIRLAAAPSKDVLVGLRCEDLLLDPEGSVQVTVDIIEALGPDTLAYCHPIAGKAGGGVSDQSAIIVRLPGTRRPAPGDAIRLSVRAGHGHVFDPASGLRCL